LAELGATLLEPYHGALEPHRVRCAGGHLRNTRPADVAKGHGVCRICTGDDKDTAEAAFRAALTAAGSVLLEPAYRGNKFGHRARCKEGHENRLRPDVVARGFGVCRDCAYKTWDVFYVLQHETEPRVKFGITNLDGKPRLRTHRKFGYTVVVRLVTGLAGRVARDTEDAVRAALADAGHQPVKGREYFDVSCLGLILDVADWWLGLAGA
jgi:hypothetical protein